MTIEPDGKPVVVGGDGEDFVVARYNVDGSPDAAFGTGGVVITDFGGADGAVAVSLAPNGNRVAAGRTTHGSEFVLASYQADGSLDPAFGSGGKVRTYLGDGAVVSDMAIGHDGVILVVGTRGGDFVTARYRSDGSLDSDFGSGGTVTTDFGGMDEARSIVVGHDGSFVVAGSTGAIGRPDQEDFAIAGYDRRGLPDLFFGPEGRRTTDFGGSDAAVATAFLPDGSVVAAGTTRKGAAPSDLAIARYSPSPASIGTPFSPEEQLVQDLGGHDLATDMAVDREGGLLVAAITDQGPHPANFAVSRLLPRGTVDPTFGVDGKAISDFGGADFPFGLAIGRDGHAVAVGSTTAGSHKSDLAVARYHRDGTPDAGFGHNGKTIGDIPC